MQNIFLKSAAVILIALAIIISYSATSKKKKAGSGKASIYEFTLKTLDGQELSLSKFKGKKMLLVNVASECGYTPQYKNLQALHEKYGNKVVVIGFPANNFGGQEPG